jgi:hypothetical protein
MVNAPIKPRMEWPREPLDYESSATWGHSSRALPSTSGSMEAAIPDTLVRARRPAASSSLFGKPEIEESISDVSFAIVPGVEWTRPSLEAALLNILSRIPASAAQNRFAVKPEGFWPRPLSASDSIAILSRRSRPESVSFRYVTEEAKFRALAARWRHETLNLSSTSQMAMHPAYQRIIGMGMAVVPLILRELQEQPDWWFWALQSITGIDPVSPNCRGSLPDMAAAWLKWGRENEYLAS